MGVISFVMINILVGAIVDALTNINDANKALESGDKDPLEAICEARLNCTKGPSGKYYGDSWEMLPLPLHCGVRFDAQECPVFSANEATAAAIASNTELEEEIAELKDAIAKKKSGRRKPGTPRKAPMSARPKKPTAAPKSGSIAFETKKNAEKAARSS